LAIGSVLVYATESGFAPDLMRAASDDIGRVPLLDRQVFNC